MTANDRSRLGVGQGKRGLGVDHVGDVLYDPVDQVSETLHVGGLDRDDGVEPAVDRVDLRDALDFGDLVQILEHFLRSTGLRNQEDVSFHLDARYFAVSYNHSTGPYHEDCKIGPSCAEASLGAV